jgi:hypothetical protein
MQSNMEKKKSFSLKSFSSKNILQWKNFTAKQMKPWFPSNLVWKCSNVLIFNKVSFIHKKKKKKIKNHVGNEMYEV